MFCSPCIVRQRTVLYFSVHVCITALLAFWVFLSLGKNMHMHEDAFNHIRLTFSNYMCVLFLPKLHPVSMSIDLSVLGCGTTCVKAVFMVNVIHYGAGNMNIALSKQFSFCIVIIGLLV